MISKITIGAVLGWVALTFPAQATCNAALAKRIEMRQIATQADKDAMNIWADSELWNLNTPNQTDIWMGTATLCDGRRIVVSQIVNRQCSSSTACPVRVLMQDGGETAKVLIAYKQMCTLHGTFAYEPRANRLMACNESHALVR